MDFEIRINRCPESFAELTETQAPIEDAQVEIAEEIQPELQRIGGFSVIIDDDED